MLPNVWFGFFSLLFQVLLSFYQISATQKTMFSIPLATDQTPSHFLQVLGSRGLLEGAPAVPQEAVGQQSR